MELLVVADHERSKGLHNEGRFRVRTKSCIRFQHRRYIQLKSIKLDMSFLSECVYEFFRSKCNFCPSYTHAA